jgi:parallel beta-helix repeat protein/predicted outer membrane repeat protein
MKIIFFISLFLLLSTISHTTIINIPDDYPSIQEGINAAVDTDTVLVQPGTYVENINFNGMNITVASLFLTTQDTTYISTTIIDGNQDGSVVNFGNGEDSSAVLCGFTITNGSAVFGGGISCSNSHQTLVNVTISNNSAIFGGGIYCDQSNANLENVTITGNTAGTFGGGIYCSNSSPSLANVTISGNSAGNDGGGIWCGYNSNPELVNCILWNDLPEEIYNSSGSVTATYSDIEGGWAGTGNIDEDPLFANSPIGDFHLTENSPCIDAGDPFLSTDPDGTRADMGAYYFHHIGVEEVYANFYADPTNGDLTLLANFYDSSVAFNTEITTWLWDFDNDGTIDSYEQNPSYIYQNVGFYSVSLTVEDDIGTSNTMIKTDYIAVYPPDYFHINPEGSDEFGNGSPEYPFATIQHGISVVENGDAILVHQGTYTENINFNGKNITVGSLFLTTQDTTYISQTIIVGNQNGSVVTFESGEDSTAVLSGFSITNGNNTVGGGIVISNSSPTLVGNVITGNYAYFRGGGVFTTGDSSPVLFNNIICNNTAFCFGGGIGFFLCSVTNLPTVENCQIYGNTAGIYAGGLVLFDANIDVINCIISDNHAISVGGGVMVINNSDANLINCTISGNTCEENGGGIALAGSDITIINTIVEGNEAIEGAGIYFDQPGNADISFSDFFNGVNNFEGNVPTGLGDITGFNIYGTPCDDFINIYEDPLFAGIGDDPFSLLEDSACIDSGIQDTTGLKLPLYDIIGNERIVDGRGDGFAFIDMGAYEHPEPVGGNENTIVQTIDFLHQNYPNPFNPTTTISFSLTAKDAKSAKLEIYNLKGQKVKDLSPSLCHAEPVEVRGESRYSVIWNGTDDCNKSVSSGVYFYKLKTANSEKTKKMILMK